MLQFENLDKLRLSLITFSTVAVLISVIGIRQSPQFACNSLNQIVYKKGFLPNLSTLGKQGVMLQK